MAEYEDNKALIAAAFEGMADSAKTATGFVEGSAKIAEETAKRLGGIANSLTNLFADAEDQLFQIFQQKAEGSYAAAQSHLDECMAAIDDAPVSKEGHLIQQHALQFKQSLDSAREDAGLALAFYEAIESLEQMQAALYAKEVGFDAFADAEYTIQERFGATFASRATEAIREL